MYVFEAMFLVVRTLVVLLVVGVVATWRSLR